MRTFNTGATRNSDTDKYDYEGFLSYEVLERFAKYMHKHRKQVDGTLRNSDNWQKGIPQDVYMKSMWRHFFDLWALHRGAFTRVDVQYNEEITKQEALCALLFNVMGYLFEEIQKEKIDKRPPV